jgi:DNA-binding response OmpR family regulator
MDIVFVGIGPLTETVASQLDALPLLGHRVQRWTRSAGSLIGRSPHEVVVVDATQDVLAARRYCQDLAALAVAPPVIAMLAERSLREFSRSWGASDFLLEHYSLAEIQGRLIRATGIARRRAAPPPVRRYGALTLDRDNLTLSAGGASVALTRIEHAVLTLFFDNPDTVQTRDSISRHAWADSPAFGSRNIDTFICRIRRKLGEHGGYIRTVRGVGYRFSAAVDRECAALDAPDRRVA